MEEAGRTWWGPRRNDGAELRTTLPLAEAAFVQWQRCVESTRRDLADIDPDRWFEVVYEEFVADPAAGLTAILGFLDRSQRFDPVSYTHLDVYKRQVYHCMDLHPEIGRLSGEFANPVAYRILARLDAATMRRATAVVVLSEDMARSVARRDPALADKVVVLNNFALPQFGDCLLYTSRCV